MAQSIWCRQRCELLASMSAAELDLLESHSSMCHFKTREFVYFPGDPGRNVLVLTRGQVRLKDLTPDGKEIILDFIGEGELFGELALVDGARRSEFDEAFVDSQIVAIPSEVLVEVIEGRPAIARAITKLIDFGGSESRTACETSCFAPIVNALLRQNGWDNATAEGYWS